MPSALAHAGDPACFTGSKDTAMEVSAYRFHEEGARFGPMLLVLMEVLVLVLLVLVLLATANCIIIAQFPIENHCEQGKSAESPMKTIGKVQNLGDYCAIRSSVAAS